MDGPFHSNVIVCRSFFWDWSDFLERVVLVSCQEHINYSQYPENQEKEEGLEVRTVPALNWMYIQPSAFALQRKQLSSAGAGS